MASTKELISIKDQIKLRLAAMGANDGLKRTQRWLSRIINMGEVEFSNKLNSNSFKQDELDKINEVLNTNFKNLS